MKAVWPSLTHGLSYRWVQKTAISSKWITLLTQYSINLVHWISTATQVFISFISDITWGYIQYMCVPWESSLWDRNQTVEWDTVLKCSDGTETPFSTHMPLALQTGKDRHPNIKYEHSDEEHPTVWHIRPTLLTAKHYCMQALHYSGNPCYHQYQNPLPSCLLSKNKMIKICITVILPCCVIWVWNSVSQTLREQHRLRVFENRVWRKRLHNEKPHDLYSSPNLIRVIKLTLILLMWRIWWAPNNASKWQMGFNLVFKGLRRMR